MKFLRFVLILCSVVFLTVSLPEKTRPAQPAGPGLAPTGKASPMPAATTPVALQARARLSESYGQLPLSFEANQGQADSEVKYLSRGSGYQLQLKATEAELRLRTAAGSVPETQSAIVRMKLVNANPAPQMAGRDELPGKSHYYIGNDPKNWRTNVANFAKVEYEQVWPGIDLVYYGNQRQLEYDFIVAPGAQPNAIRFTFDGADKVKLDAQGNLVLHVAGGEVVMQQPFVYQEVNGTRQQIAGNYQIRTPHSALRTPTVGFQLGAYDESKPLVIDPVLVYSTYLGPASRDIANDIAVDQAGNVYITGASFFSSEGGNAFVAKLNAAGTTLLYSTALIGSRDEIGFGVAVDAAGNAYATGFTRSTNFPVRNAYQPRLGATDCRNSIGCPDAFVVKLDAAGTIAWSTYLGGNDNPGDISAFGDLGYDIAVDGSGQAVVTGSTVSRNFPVKNAYQPAGAVGTGSLNTVNDGFITKFNAAGSDLVYSTYLGGNGADVCHGIALDAAGNAYVTGQTNRVFNDVVNSFPTTANAFQRTPAADLQDGFVAKLSAAGNALAYSTYLGGNDRDQGEAIAVDPAGNAYVIGATSSTNFPLDGAHQAVNLGGSAFVTKLNPSGSGLLYSSYLGKQVWIRTGTSPGAAIAVDTAGIAHVIGSTSAADFPVVNALYPTFGGGPRDAYLAKINTVTKTVVYVTYLGGSVTDSGYGIALDAAGNAYATGETNSANFPLKNPLQPALGSSDFNSDTFVTKISDDTICPSAALPEAAEADADKLALSNVMPPDGDTVSGASLKIGGLKATVTYLLQSADNAILDVTLFDQAGNIRYDFGTIPVKKPTVCPPPDSSQEIALDRSRLDLTPKDGIEVTSLRLTARLISTGGALIKRAEVNYKVIPDAIAFDSTPSINGQAAPDGSRLPSSGTVNFTSTIKYHLTNDVTGRIRLQVFNANGGGQIASKDLTPNVAATAQPTLWNTPLDFQFTVPPNVSEISVVASLLAENGTLLKTSTPLFYRNKLRIELGVKTFGSAFVPFPPGQWFKAGTDSLTSLSANLALKVKDDLPASLQGSRFVILLAQRLNNGTLIRGPQQVSFQQDEELPRPSFHLSNISVIPDDVDKWEFQLLILPPNKAPQIESEIYPLPINRLRIVSANPAFDTRLQAGKEKQEFTCLVAYNTTPERLIRAQVTSILAVTGKEELVIEFSNSQKAAGASSTGEAFKFSLDLSPNLIELRVEFFYNSTGITSKAKAWEKFDRPAFRFNAEEKQFISGLGVDVATVENKINRLIAQGRSAQDAKQTVVEALLKARSASSQPDSSAVEAVAETLATSSLFQNFVGLNAAWQFDPPIPADGSFIADLKFYYRADDLPDDPNFNEATMKVIGFDPATGKLESYPTTIDLNAKTATARVNGLMPMYSLGVTGPLAHRTFNFPVLRSLDDFTTQLHFASVGTGSAALNTRAFDSLGQLFSGQGLVNPATTTLPAGRTLTVSASDLFKFNGLVDGGWMQTHADKNFIAAYQMLGKDTRRDGLAPPAFLAGTQVLTDVQFDATATTEIHLANVTKFATNLTLDLRTTAGTQAGSYDTALEPKETFARRVQDIFSNLPQPFSGYLIVRADHDLSAAALQLSETEIVALNGQVPLAGATATKLYAPYVVTDRQAITTRLNLINPTINPANLTLKLVSETGANLAPPVSLPLTAGQQSQRDVAQLFGLSPGNLIYGSLIVESSVSGVVGDVSYYDPSGQFKYRTALPLESEAAKFLAFAHLDNGESSFTDVGIFNPGTQTANVTFRVLRADGTETGRATGQIPAGAHYSNLLDSIVAASFRQVGGSFTITSDQPIVAAAAFGTLDGATLSALPAQAFDPTTFTRANTTVSAASYRGPELAADSIVAAFGADLATSVVAANTVPLPTTLAGTTVRVRDSAGVERLAPLFFVAPQQVNYQLPPGTAAGAATVTITSGDGALSTGAALITAVAPGLFAANADGQGPPAGYAIRVKADGAQVNEAITRFDTAQNKFALTPLDLGPTGEQVFLVLFGTGFRAVSSLSAVSVRIGGVEAQVLYAGTQGGFVGLDQMNLLVPRALIGRGEVELVMTINDRAANTLKLNLK